MIAENCENNSNNFGKFVTIVLLMAIATLTLFLVGSLDNSHAVEKHTTSALVARDCIDKNGSDFIYNKDEDKKVQLCFVGLDSNGNFKELAIRVVKRVNGKWEEITAFTNKNIHTVNEAISFAEGDMGTYGWFSFVKESWKVLFH